MKQVFIENNDWEILGKDGWENFSGIRILSDEKFKIFHIITEKGYWIRCTDNHILFKYNKSEIKAKDVKIGLLIQVRDGIDRVSEIKEYEANTVYDIVGTDSGTTLVNGVLSKNCDEFAHVEHNKCLRCVWDCWTRA